MDQKFQPFEEEKRSNYVITDFITNMDQVSKETLMNPPRWSTRVIGYVSSITILNPALWILLMLLGILAACTGFIIDFLSEFLLDLRLSLASSEYGLFNLLLWLIYSLSFSVAGAATCYFYQNQAIGSGIPEIKAILSGIKVPLYFTWKTLLSKILGLIFAIAGGLSIGKEGPFVHISVILADKLTRLGYFKYLHQSHTFRKQIMGAAVAAGVAATFGAPIGGLLFSVEVTATYYYINNLWKGVFCSMCCVLCYAFLQLTEWTDLINLTKFETIEYHADILWFAGLGLIAGLCGVLFVRTTSRLLTAVARSPLPLFKSPFGFVVVAGTLCALLTFSTEFFRLSDKEIINEMFRADELSSYKDANWESPHVGLNLVFYFTVKLFLTGISVACQVPCGVFTPVFAAGGALGRLMGYIVNFCFGTSYVGVYAVVGAAALTSSVTHTISVAVIVFELTGQIHYILPMLVAVVISYAIGSSFSKSIYDILLEMKGLPYLPTLKSSKMYKLCAKDIMLRTFTSVPYQGEFRELLLATNNCKPTQHKIPFIDNQGVLMGDCSVSYLKKYLATLYIEKAADKDHDALMYAYQVLGQGQQTEGPPDMNKVVSLDFWDAQFNFGFGGIDIDHSPFTVSEETPLAKVHFLFIMLSVAQLYVTSRGQLIGLLSRDDFIQIF